MWSMFNIDNIWPSHLSPENTDCETHGEREIQAETEVKSERVKGESDTFESLK